MLINFKMKNFMSFREEADLSMEVGERLRKFNETHTIEDNKVKLLKSILMFGPNGSGKSNLIMGLNTMKKMILKDTTSITEELAHFPFLLGENTEPTSFEIEFISNDIRYEYGFSYNEEEYLTEKLIYKEVNKQKKIHYQRTFNYIEYLDPTYESFKKITRKNSLLLYNLQNANDSHAINVTNWFFKNLTIDSPPTEKLINVLKSPEKKELFLDILKLSDFSIKDIEFSQIEVPISELEKQFFSFFSKGKEDNLPQTTLKTTINTIYHQYDFENNDVKIKKLPLHFESSGTQRFIDIILTILQRDDNGQVLIFDEFDDSFHLILAQSLLKLINSNFNQNQFIFTSHQIEHLNSDLRTDQIYLVEKDFDGESNLYSLFDFNKESADTDVKTVRHDTSLVRKYLEGTYGSVPNILLNRIIENSNKISEIEEF